MRFDTIAAALIVPVLGCDRDPKFILEKKPIVTEPPRSESFISRHDAKMTNRKVRA